MTKTLNAHGRAAVLCTWLAALSWSLPAAAQGLAAASLSDGLRTYDYESIAWAVLVATVGGFGRTVLTLLSPNIVVLGVLRETWKDLLIAALAGVVAAVILNAVQSLGVAIPVPLMVLVLAACGWARMGVFVWAEKSARTIADRGTQWAADKLAKPDPYGTRRDVPWRDTPPRAPRVDNPENDP